MNLTTARLFRKLVVKMNSPLVNSNYIPLRGLELTNVYGALKRNVRLTDYNRNQDIY